MSQKKSNDVYCHVRYIITSICKSAGGKAGYFVDLYCSIHLNIWKRQVFVFPLLHSCIDQKYQCIGTRIWPILLIPGLRQETKHTYYYKRYFQGDCLREDLNREKTFSFGHCPNEGGRGGVYPCPNFLALSQEVQFWSIKRVYFFKKPIY